MTSSYSATAWQWQLPCGVIVQRYCLVALSSIATVSYSPAATMDDDADSFQLPAFNMLPMPVVDWSADPKSKMQVQCAEYCNNKLYVGSSDGRIFCYGLSKVSDFEVRGNSEVNDGKAEGKSLGFGKKPVVCLVRMSSTALMRTAAHRRRSVVMMTGSLSPSGGTAGGRPLDCALQRERGQLQPGALLSQTATRGTGLCACWLERVPLNWSLGPRRATCSCAARSRRPKVLSRPSYTGVVWQRCIY